VQEGVLRVADVDKGGLEARVEVLDPALVDAADHPVVGLALDLELLEAAVDEERDALLEGLGIDDELAVGALFLLEAARIFWRSGRCWARSAGAAFSSAALTAATSRWIGGLASSSS
jgi:hypothetical protein